MSELNEVYRKVKSYAARGIVAGALVGALIVGGLIGMIHSTGETEVGVRTRKVTLFAKKGVEERVYQPGAKYFFPPVINDWNTLDTKLVNVEMTAVEGEGERAEMDDLRFKTIDGNDIGLDVIISYRIDPSKATYIVQFVAENDDALKDKVFRTIARSRPRDLFGELTSEEFYDAGKRNEAAEKAKKALEEILEPYGIIVEKVASKDYRFNPGYEDAIKNKKLADAKTLEFRSQTKAQLEMNKQMLREADGQVNEMKARVNGQYQEAVLSADAYFDQQGKLAQATVAEGEAEAKGISAQRLAMTSAGGETLVKMKIAESLTGKRIVMLPGAGADGTGIQLQTLDVNKLFELYGIRGFSSQSPAESNVTEPRQAPPEVTEPKQTPATNRRTNR